MKHPKVVIAVAIVVVVLIIAFFVRNGERGVIVKSDDDTLGTVNGTQNQTNQNGSGNTSTVSSNITSGTGTKVTLAQLAVHNNLESCWISYKGKVYDITSFLPRHPGSAGAILPYCGSAGEFEAAFTKKHGTSKVSVLMQVGTFIGDFDVIGKVSA